jgi:cation-transporting ATPase E
MAKGADSGPVNHQSISESNQLEPGLPGISNEEASRRRANGQGNEFVVRSSRSYREILQENLLTFFNLVLFGVSLALLILGSARDAFLTAYVALFNVLVASIQEVRAKRKLDHISLITRPKVTLIREGKLVNADPGEIVLGDLQLIQPGDQITVDGVVVADGQIDVDESLLSGESEPVHKKEGDELFSGSFCLSGRAIYEATAVGRNSFANKMTEGARHFSREYTPLQRDVDLIIRMLLLVVVFFGILIALNFIINEEMTLLESAQSAAVVFGLAPSSLFLTIVVAYAVGAIRLANKGALVQQANSVESLCHVTVLCLDKTGTLTSNKITLDELLTLPESGMTEEELRLLLGSYARSGSTENRTSQAIVSACAGDRELFQDEVPFSSDRKWSALSFNQDPWPGTYILGAPEVMGPYLVGNLNLENQVDSWAGTGYRVLLFARNDEAQLLLDKNERPQLPERMIPLGLLGFRDQLRPDAKETLTGFSRAGIKLKIISGDNPRTVAALASQAGLDDNPDKPLKAVSGPKLDEMDELHFAQAAAETDIFGRISPAQKQRLVRALRDQGHYVAMTGDGVNDVLAMKQANLGIAMQSGSPATRSASDIVLLEDSFSALPLAFIEGQRILNGMEDIFRLYMTRIFSLALLISTIAMLAAGFPFTPSQSSILAMLTISIPAIALALWARPGPLRRKSMVRRLVYFILPASVTISAAGLAVYLIFLVITDDREYAQLTLTYAMLAMGLILIVFVEPPTEFWVGGDELSGDWRPTLLAFGLLFAFLIALTAPITRDFLGLAPLHQPQDYLIIIGVTVIWVLVLRFTWRAHLVDRYLNNKLAPRAN